MDVGQKSVLSVFDTTQRLEVPLFQRQYVWSEENEWLPLWEDIKHKFEQTLEPGEGGGGPHHFLGALVLDQKRTNTGYVPARHIIDGQQRLTTLQIFLAAYRDFCRENGCGDWADECGKYIKNTGMVTDEDERFKVWPTQVDRPQFKDVINSESKEELLRLHPLTRRGRARKPNPRPRMVEAYLFFHAHLIEFFIGAEDEPPLGAESPLTQRIHKCLQSLRDSLMVVVIDLDEKDDAQVIFETLNARGQELLPADLLRNYVFLRVSRAELDMEAIYEEYWAPFDDDFWRETIRQGRYSHPRSNLFMQHFLASWQARDISVKHLYVEYRHWIDNKKPFGSVSEELQTIARQRDHFRRIINPDEDDTMYPLSRILETFDSTTAHPLLLAMMDANLEDSEWKQITKILESYIVRRAVCHATAKNYNRFFLSLIRDLRDCGFSAENLNRLLLEQRSESGLWPDDSRFREAWINSNSYALGHSRLVYVLVQVNETFRSSKSERINFGNEVSVEHLMPNSWQKHWLLPDGSSGMELLELYGAEEDDPRALATRERNNALSRMGNLTIISAALNSAQKNLPWDEKRPALLENSELLINQMLHSKETWDEATISQRAAELFKRAVEIWPHGVS